MYSIKAIYPYSAKFALSFFASIILGLSITNSAENTVISPATKNEISQNGDTSSLTGSMNVEIPQSDNGLLIKDALLVLTGNYPDIDTVGLIAKIQERLQWGEKDDRLIEAEGILHWGRGETHLALPCLRRLAQPSPIAMGIIGEGFLKKGERYEAAVWFLNAARTYPTTDPAAIPLYRKYLEIKTGQGKVEMELASRLEILHNYGEALDIYYKHQAEILVDTASVLRIGTMLSSQGREKDAIALYRLALETHKGNKAMWVRQAQTREALNQKVEAAQAWIGVWTIDPTDTTARNRAISHFEASGVTSDALLESLLEKALELDPLSAPLHFKLAVVHLHTNDRAMAYSHLEQALKISPKNPTYLSRISDAIDGDDLIRLYFNQLKAQSEKDGVTIRLLQQVARGYSLTGDKNHACRTWIQANSLSAQALDGRRDALMDLLACNDPASQTLAEILGEKFAANNSDREVLEALVKISLRNRSFTKASSLLVKLVNSFPEMAPAALANAKAFLTAKDEVSAKSLLIAISLHAPIPEASFLLGKLHLANKDWALASEQFALAGPVYPEALKLRAGCLLELKDLQGAVAEYANHYSQTGDKESLRIQPRLYLQLGNTLQEKLSLEAVNEKLWASEEEKLHLGFLHASQGDTAKAALVFIDLFRAHNPKIQDSLWSKAALLLGQQMVREGNCDKAIKFLSLGIKTASAALPNRAEIWLQIGDCYIEKSLWTDAYLAYNQGLEIDPMSLNLARGELQAAKMLGDKVRLGNAYRAIYLLDPSDEDANAFLGPVRVAAKEYKEAVVHFQKIADLHPDQASAMENLGNALAMIPDLPAAAIPLQAAIDLGANSDEVYINRARAYRIEASRDLASSLLDYMLSQDPENYLALLWTAKFAEEDGNQQLALEMFKKVSKRSPPRTLLPELVDQGMLEAKAPSN
jgi:tetratricopeptide (TPR) repeat protein